MHVHGGAGLARKAWAVGADDRRKLLLDERIETDRWPEYYDGKRGGLIGRRANYFQVWSVTGLIVAREILENPDSRELFDRCTRVDIDAVHDKMVSGHTS